MVGGQGRAFPGWLRGKRKDWEGKGIRARRCAIDGHRVASTEGHRLISDRATGGSQRFCRAVARGEGRLLGGPGCAPHFWGRLFETAIPTVGLCLKLDLREEGSGGSGRSTSFLSRSLRRRMPFCFVDGEEALLGARRGGAWLGGGGLSAALGRARNWELVRVDSGPVASGRRVPCCLNPRYGRW